MDDFFAGFDSDIDKEFSSDPKPQTTSAAPAAPAADQAVVIERSKIRSASQKHEDFGNLRQWVDYVYEKFEFSKETRVCRMVRYELHDACINILVEFSEFISAINAAAAANMKVDMKALVLAQGSVSYLESALQTFDDASKITQIYISSQLVDKDLIMPFSPDRTLAISASNLLDKLSTLASVEVYDFGATSVQPLTGPVTPAMAEQHMMTSSITTSMDNLRHSSLPGIEIAIGAHRLSKTNNSDTEVLKGRYENTQQRLGYINETTFRLHLRENHGVPFAEGVRVECLVDLVSWIGEKINASSAQKIDASEILLKFCLGDFDGYGKADNKPNVLWTEVSKYIRTILI